jgi:hypothetical protein
LESSVSIPKFRCLILVDSTVALSPQVHLPSHSHTGSVKQIYSTWSRRWPQSSQSSQSDEAKRWPGFYVTSVRSRSVRDTIASTEQHCRGTDFTHAKDNGSGFIEQRDGCWTICT